MDSTSVVYLSQFKPADPQNRPCRIIGKLQNLQKLSYKQVGPLLSPRANEETWSAALEALKKSDTCSLWLVNAIAAVLPYKATRHNSPSRPHALTRIVNSLKLSDAPECAFVIVCERSEVYSLGCAIARSFPHFNTSSSSKLQKKKTIEVSFILVGDNDDTSPLNGDELAALNESCEGIRLAQYIVDCPCNEMHTDGFLEQVKTVGSKLGIEPFVIRGEDLNQQGFGGLYGVGKAAVHPPVLAVLSHTPPGATKTIAWVGKGIVYDTGGLSMKTKTTMPGMKRDCGGAAAILSAFYTAVTLGFTQNLHAVLCLAENAVGPLAARPDDIHIMYSGKSVEVNNTDAEGRLVLGDGVAYACKDLKADIIVDMATLTGAQGIATGKYHGAVLTNDGDIEDSCMTAGRTSGDLVFPIPFTPELHFSEFNSSVADMKNSVKDRSNAQVSCAGLFIFSHLGFDFPGTWLHIDMASPVHSGERATGYGVALLNALFGSCSSNPYMASIAPPLSGTDDVSTKKKKI